MKSMRFREHLMVICAASALATPSLSWAASADGSPPSANVGSDQDQLQEIIVTSRKRSERLIDIPESIAVISATELKDKGIVSVEDVGRQTPNLQLNMRQDTTTDVVIRGIGAYGDVLGVGFDIDGVPNFTDQTMRLEDLESVEILKGPQGTLYGGSSIGGLIRYVSKKPAFNWEGEASAEVGSYSQISTFAAQNVPLIADKLALRVSAYDAKGDGYVTNSALGINAAPFTDYGVRVALLFRPTDSTDALLTLRHSWLRLGSNAYPPVPNVNSYTYDAPLFQPTVNTRMTNGGVLELNDNFSIAKLTSITSLTSAQAEFNYDVTQTPPGFPGESYYTLPGNRPTQVATQEFRLTSPSSGKFEWLAGLYGAIIKNTLQNQIGATFFPTPALPTRIIDFDTKRTDTAAFGTATYHLGRLRLDAGVRLTKTVYDAMVYIEAGQPNQSASVTSSAALPKVSISYALPAGGQVYATVAKGEEPGAVNTVSTAPIPYKAETALNYEIGAKSEALDSKLEYEVAAFYASNKNHQYQTNQIIPSLGGIIVLTSNIGDSRTYGVEANANWHPTSELHFGLGGGYLNARWTTATVFGARIDGNVIPNAPAATANASAGYSQPVFTKLEFDANFDLSYTDAMWWDLPNTPGSKENPHWIGNARVALGTQGRGWQVALRVTNLLSAKYWTEYYPNIFQPGGYPCNGCSDVGAIGAPRQFYGSVTYKY
jgi:iron complex outermembrane recepter protein